ncbi:MAG: hypothetical protein WC492_00310 [Candidatus Micrarchaeia archaeon]
MEMECYSPAKAILFGEHYVVYGAGGIVLAIEPNNQMRVGVQAKNEAGALFYKSTISQSSLEIGADECIKKQNITHPIEAVYKRLLLQTPALEKMDVNVRLEKCWPIKGVGNSASISAAFSCGVRTLVRKSASQKDIFEDVQAADDAAHGRASGIDAAAVSMGGVVEFKKIFSSSNEEKNAQNNLQGSKNAGARIERITDSQIDGYTFILIDSAGKNGQKASTKEQVELFAKEKGVKKMPAELEEKERKKIVYEYEEIYSDAKKALLKKDANLLAKCMNQNHKLLQNANVSSPEIEKSIKISLDSGADAAKLSGAGGKGGAAIAFVADEKVEKVIDALKKGKISSYKFCVAEMGAHCE